MIASVLEADWRELRDSDTCKNIFARVQILHVAIRHRVGDCAAGVLRRDDDQAIQIGHARNAAENDVLNPTERGGVRANPERERQDSDARERQILGEQPEREPHITNDGLNRFHVS